MKKTILILIILISFGCNSEEKKAPNPSTELKVVELMINDAIYTLNSKEWLEMNFPKLDSIIINFPNTKEAKRAEYLLSKKDSLYALIDNINETTELINFEALLVTRKNYSAELRNFYLDQGLDIEVIISGENYDEMSLEYALFSDVWFRKFETNGDFENWFKMGFKKVTLSDKYDYNKYKYIKE